MRKKATALLMSVLVALYIANPQLVQAVGDLSTVRVWLASMGTPSEVLFFLHGGYQIKNHSDNVLTEGGYSVSLSDGQLLLKDDTGEALSMGKTFTLEAVEDGAYLHVSNTAYGELNYLGSMTFSLDEEGIRLINSIRIEQYLYGVLPDVMGEDWPIEALKAQAVVARTYAVRSLQQRSTYDLVDTAENQIYQGYIGGGQNTAQAILETRGLVLKYEDEVASAYSTLSNGGMTESSLNRWGEALSYSKVIKDPYDLRNRDNSKAVWVKKYHQTELSSSLRERLLEVLENRLGDEGYSTEDILIRGIKDIRIEERTSSDRIEAAIVTLTAEVVRIEDHAHVTADIDLLLDGERFWRVFNTPSCRMTIDYVEGEWVFSGGGDGHGVGMSLYGAAQMAREANAYTEILSFYYPGTYLGQSGTADEQDDAEILPTRTQLTAAESTPSDENEVVLYGTVKVMSVLNVRQGPGLQYKSIAQVPNNARVVVLEEAVGGDWIHIKAAEAEGYVNAEYIETDFDIEGQTRVPDEQKPIQHHYEDFALPPDNKRHLEMMLLTCDTNAGPGTKNHMVGMTEQCFAPEAVMAEMSDEVIALPIEEQIEGMTMQDHMVDEVQTQESIEADLNSTQTEPRYGCVAAGSALIKADAGIVFRTIDILSRGTQVKIVGEKNHWYFIETAGCKGYVYAPYIEIEALEQGHSSISATEVLPKQAVVAGLLVNVREGAGIEYSVLKQVKIGEAVEITGQEGRWIQVNTGQVSGYIRANYLTADREAGAQNVARIAASNVNVRQGPGYQYRIKGQLDQGLIVNVLKEENVWCKIQVGNVEGYVHGAYLIF